MRIFGLLLIISACLSVVAVAISRDGYTSSFVNMVQPSTTPTAVASEREKAAKASLKRLVDLQTELKNIPIDKQNNEPHKSFIKKNEKEITYSEPAGEYFVRSELFWDLYEEYKDLPLGEEIAWKAAQNPLPGECEGFVNCYLFLIRSTDGRYLDVYPNGKHSPSALRNMTSLLGQIVADPAAKPVYTGPTDSSDRAELTRLLGELNTIVSKVTLQEKAKVLTLIKHLSDGFGK